MVRDNIRICASIVGNDLEAVKKVGPLVDMFELRIDLIGGDWRQMVAHLEKPWIACNRRVEEDGRWQGSEPDRIDELLSAVGLGAAIVDIELATPGVEGIVGEIKGKAECLLSYHNLRETPTLESMRQIVSNQLAAGAGICKVVTTAQNFTDNISVLQLISDFPESRIISFAMGSLGHISRILCPLAGGYLTYASIEEGRESAPGQITVRDLTQIYEKVMVHNTH